MFILSSSFSFIIVMKFCYHGPNIKFFQVFQISEILCVWFTLLKLVVHSFAYFLYKSIWLLKSIYSYWICQNVVEPNIENWKPMCYLIPLRVTVGWVVNYMWKFSHLRTNIKSVLTKLSNIHNKLKSSVFLMNIVYRENDFFLGKVSLCLKCYQHFL